jgi:tetratricopeptide (TPR) repeat protein
MRLRRCAVAALAAALAALSGCAAADFEEGRDALAANDPDRAIRCFDAVLAGAPHGFRLGPPDAMAYNARGLAYAVKGEDDKALADYNEAIRLDPGWTNAYVNRALLYARRGQYERARADQAVADRLSSGTAGGRP